MFDKRKLNVGDIIIHKFTKDVQYVLTKRKMVDDSRENSMFIFKYKTTSPLTGTNFVSSWTLDNYDIQYAK